MSQPSGAHTQSSLIRSNHNAPLTRLVLLSLVVLLSVGCAPLMSALASIGQGSQFAGSVVDAAEAGSRAYLARHPNRETEQKIDDAVRRARYALAALDGAVAASKSADAGDVQATRAEALAAVLALRTLLAELGVLDATPAIGGSEGDGPTPKPVPLPSAAVLEAALALAE